MTVVTDTNGKRCHLPPAPLFNKLAAVRDQLVSSSIWMNSDRRGRRVFRYLRWRRQQVQRSIYLGTDPHVALRGMYIVRAWRRMAGKEPGEDFQIALAHVREMAAQVDLAPRQRRRLGGLIQTARARNNDVGSLRSILRDPSGEVMNYVLWGVPGEPGPAHGRLW